jgi:ribonuclease VapC
MVLDTSALLAVVFDEADAKRFRDAIEEDETRLVSLLETTIVAEARKGEAAGRELELLVQKAGMTAVPVDNDHRQTRAPDMVTRYVGGRFTRMRSPASDDCVSIAWLIRSA